MSKFYSFLWGVGVGLLPSMVLSFSTGEWGFYEHYFLPSLFPNISGVWIVGTYVIAISMIYSSIVSKKRFVNFIPHFFFFIGGWFLGFIILLGLSFWGLSGLGQFS